MGVGGDALIGGEGGGPVSSLEVVGRGEVNRVTRRIRGGSRFHTLKLWNLVRIILREREKERKNEYKYMYFIKHAVIYLHCALHAVYCM